MFRATEAVLLKNILVIELCVSESDAKELWQQESIVQGGGHERRQWWNAPSGHYYNPPLSFNAPVTTLSHAQSRSTADNESDSNINSAISISDIELLKSSGKPLTVAKQKTVSTNSRKAKLAKLADEVITVVSASSNTC